MPWIQAPDARAHLNKLSTVDDPELQGFIDAACGAIELVKGHVDVVDETVVVHADRRGVVLLPETPVVAVTSVTRIFGGGVTAPVVEADPVADVDGWTLTSSGGVLTLPSPWWVVQVVYTAGLNPVPSNIRLAALELVAHLWRASQLNSGGGRPQQGETDQLFIPGIANALPIRVRELLGLYGRVVRDEVFIA